MFVMVVIMSMLDNEVKIMDVMTNKEYIDVLEIYLDKYKKFSEDVGYEQEITENEGDILYSMILSLVGNIGNGILKDDINDVLESMSNKLIPGANSEEYKNED